VDAVDYGIARKYVLIDTNSSEYLSNISTTLISLFLDTRELMRSKALS